MLRSQTEALADQCEEQIKGILSLPWSQVGGHESYVAKAAAVRDLAEAAVILRTQQIPGQTYR